MTAFLSTLQPEAPQLCPLEHTLSLLTLPSRVQLDLTLYYFNYVRLVEVCPCEAGRRPSVPRNWGFRGCEIPDVGAGN